MTRLNECKNYLDNYFMSKCLKISQEALEVAEVPIGCIIVYNVAPGSLCSVQCLASVHDSYELYKISSSVIISHGTNQVNSTKDPTRHAEIVAIDRLLTGAIFSDQAQSSHFSDLLYSYCASNDHWINIHDDPFHWKNSYGWGSGRKLKKEIFSECDVFVTCEPCIMCAAALSKLGVRRVHFGLHNDRFGGFGSRMTLQNPTMIPNLLHSPIITHKTEGKAIKLLKIFYSQKNTNKSVTKKKKLEINFLEIFSA